MSNVLSSNPDKYPMIMMPKVRPRTRNAESQFKGTWIPKKHFMATLRVMRRSRYRRHHHHHRHRPYRRSFKTSGSTSTRESSSLLPMVLKQSTTSQAPNSSPVIPIQPFRSLPDNGSASMAPPRPASMQQRLGNEIRCKSAHIRLEGHIDSTQSYIVGPTGIPLPYGAPTTSGAVYFGTQPQPKSVPSTPSRTVTTPSRGQ